MTRASLPYDESFALQDSFKRWHPVEAEAARLAALEAWHMNRVWADIAETAVPPAELATPIVPWWRRP